MRPQLFRRSIALLVAAFCCAGLLACDGKAQRESDSIEHGKALFAAHEDVKASLEFRTALQINPVGATAQYYLGLIAERASNGQDAYRHFSAAADADPKNPDYALAAGKLALLGGDPKAALWRADAAIALAPRNAEAHALKAAALLKRGQFPEATAALEQSRALDPNNATATTVAFGLAIARGDRDSARALLEAGLAADPQSEALLLLKLSLAGEDKDLATADAVLRGLVALRPGNVNYWRGLVQVAMLRQKPEEAEQALRAGIAAEPDAKDLRLLLVRFLALRGAPDRAEQELQAAIAADPDEPAYRLGVASLYRAEGKLDAARGVLQALRDSSTTVDDTIEARLALARIAIAGGDRASALEEVAGVLTVEPRNADALLMRAGLAMTERRFDAAITDLTAVVIDQPKRGPAWLLLCSAFDATHQASRAIDCRRQYLTVDPAAAAVRVDLARRLMQAGRQDEAAREVDLALAQSPGLVSARLLRIDQKIDRRDWAAAEQDARALIAAGAPGQGNAALGKVFLAAKRYADAIAALTEARQSAPDDPDLLALLVAAHLAADDPAAARTVASAAVARDPRHPAPRVIAADLAFRDGDAGTAESELRQAIALKPDWTLPYLKLGSLLRSERRPQDAIAVFRAGLKQAPDNPDLLLKTALTEDMAGQFDAAWNDYAALLKIQPDNTVVANNMAALAADIWPEDKARLDLAGRLVERFRGTSDPNLLDTFGWVQVRLGNTASAVVALQRAVAARPDDPQFRYHLGVAYHGEGNVAKASEALQAATETDRVYRGKADALRILAEISPAP